MREGWTYKKLGEVCEKGTSDISINKIENNHGDYPLYGASGYVKGIDFYHQNKSYIGIVKDGSGAGRVDIYPPFSSLVGTMQYIYTKDSCTLDYLKYALISLQLEKYKTGAAIPHIYFKDYSKCLIPVPPLSEQERIVSELDLLSSIIEKKKAQLKEYDQLAQSIFYDMFGDPVTNEKGWEVKKLGEVCTFTQGIQVPIEEQRLVKEDDDILFLRIIDFTQGKEEPRYVKCPNERYILHEHEIAIVRYGTPGFVCYGKIGAIANNLFKITPNQKDMFDFLFLIHWLKSDAFQSSVKEKQYGAALQAIKFSTIQNINIYIPQNIIQQQFAEKIEAIEKQKELIKQSIAETESLFNSRMDFYFN